jgi:hypothetical protein
MQSAASRVFTNMYVFVYTPLSTPRGSLGEES